MDCAVRSMSNLESLRRGCSRKDGGKSSEEAKHTAALRALALRPWQLLEQLTAQGLQPDRYTCSIIVKGMHVSGAAGTEIDRAIELLRRIGRFGLQPQSEDNGSAGQRRGNIQMVEVLFNTLLDICTTSRDLDRMSEIFGMMQEFKVSISSVTFGVLIKAFGQAGRLQRCREVWEGMLSSGVQPTVVTFGCYIDACIRNKDMAGAESVYQSMTSSKVRPNAVIYTSLIRGLAATGEPAKALMMYHTMRKNGVEPTSVTFNSILDMAARQLTDPAILQSILDDMRSANAAPDSVICAILIKASCSSGKLDNAIGLFQEMRTKGFQCDQVALHSLLLSCCQADRVADSEEIFAEMRRDRVAPSRNEATALVKMYGRARLPQKAESVVDILRVELNAKPNLQVYAALIQAFAQNKMWRRSVDVFKKLPSYGIEPDAPTHATIIQGCAKAGDFETAMEVVRHATVRLQPDVLQGLLQAMTCKEHQHPLARELDAIMREEYNHPRLEKCAGSRRTST
jgi:pentatricopeptide repeat protein